MQVSYPNPVTFKKKMKSINTGEVKLSRSRNYVDEKEGKNLAEVIRYDGMWFIVDQPTGAFENRDKLKRIPWQAVYTGETRDEDFVVDGYAREFVIEKTIEILKRRKGMEAFKGLMRKRYVQQAVDDLISGKDGMRKK